MDKLWGRTTCCATARCLDQAAKEGEVRIRRKDGRVFVIRLAPKVNSPLDVEGIDLGMSAAEIAQYVREGQRPPYPQMDPGARGEAEE